MATHATVNYHDYHGGYKEWEESIADPSDEDDDYEEEQLEIKYEEEEDDIPAPTITPILVHLSSEEVSNAALCVFDIETTSLYDNCEIVQLAAITIDKQKRFVKHILPVGDICPSASDVHGFTKGPSGLYYKGKVVPSVPLKDAFQAFLKWIGTLESQQVVMIGQNCKLFDLKHLHRLGLPFKPITGFIDTLPLFREMFPNEPSRSLSHIYQLLFNKEFNAHNALDDVKALAEVLRKLKVDLPTLLAYSFTSSSAAAYYTHLIVTKINMRTFHRNLPQKVLSEGMTKRASASGLQFEHLETAWIKDGEEGIRNLFTEDVGGKPRVTKKKNIIQSVVNYFYQRENSYLRCNNFHG